MLFPSNNTRKERRRRLGQAGLHSLMRDPRYLDGNHAEHGAVMDLVRRGFQLVFDEPDDADGPSPIAANPLGRRRGRTLLTGAQMARPFADAVARLAGKNEKADSLRDADREALGRRALLSALKTTRAAFPSGFAEELRALGRIESRAAQGTPAPSKPPPADRKPEKPKETPGTGGQG